MKKILSILLTMLMLVSVICVAPVSASAAEVETAQTGATVTSDGTARLYFNMKAVSWWDAASSGGGNFAYFFNNSTGKNSWSTKAVKYSGDTYYVDIPAGNWAGVVLTRNSTTTAPSWNNKWNQSGDITLSATSNYISKFSEGSTSVTWGTAIKPASTAGITASATEVETGAEVKLSTALTSNADINTISAVTYSVNSEAATVENDVFTAAEAGEYKVTAEVTYYANCYTSLTSTATATATITVTDPVVEPEVTEPEVTEPEATEPEATEPEATEPEVSTITIYFENNWTWPEVSIYYWGGADGENATWPGEVMTEIVGKNGSGEFDIYKMEIPSDVTGVIFSGEGAYGRDQSADVTEITDGTVYYMVWDDATSSKICGSYPYVAEDPVEPEATEPEATEPVETEPEATEPEATEPEATEPVETEPEATEPVETEPEATEPEKNDITIYFSNSLFWEGTINAYAWDADGQPVLGGWPGTGMTYVDTNEFGQAIYSVVLPAEATNIIFNNGSVQTADFSTASFYDGVGIYLVSESEFGTYEYIAPVDPEPTEPEIPATSDEPVPTEPEPTEPEVGEDEIITVFFQNNWMWNDVKIYVYDDNYSYVGEQWPGRPMDYYDNDGTYDIYSANIPADANIVINGIKDDGTGTLDQTPDITEGLYEGICYYMLWDNGNKVGSEDISVILGNSGGDNEGGDNEGGESGSEEEPCEHEFNSNGICVKCFALEEGVDAAVVGYSLTLGGTIGLNLTAGISEEIAADESAKVVITVPASGSTKEIVIPVSELEYNENNGSYKFTCEFAAKEMTIPCSVMIKTDTKEVDLGDYSVKDYCMLAMKSSVLSDAVKKIAKTMLNYGAAAQIYFDYNTDNLANNEMAEEDKIVEVIDNSAYAPVIVGEADAIEYYGAALVLESDTYLKFYFKVDEENLNASVPTITINGVYTELEKNGNLWFVEMPSLDADDYADEFVLEISYGYTVTYSANSYIYTAQNSGKEALVAVANALSAYGNATAVFCPAE